jgi:RNA polymerase sigma-70 factor (ECF subfamily)
MHGNDLDLLCDMLERAPSRYSVVALDREAFLRYVLARTSSDRPLEALHIEDLYLACACAHGNDHAIAMLDQRLVAAVRAATSRHRTNAEVADEVAQLLRTRLLVGSPERGPRIAEYGGRGPLDSWLRIAAGRLSLNLRRDRHSSERSISEATDALPITLDINILQGQVQAPFDAAFREALQALIDEDRLVLRLYFNGGMNLQGIAAALGASRATAGRRLQVARERLRSRTIQLLSEKLAVRSREIENILRTLSGKLDGSQALASLSVGEEGLILEQTA